MFVYLILFSVYLFEDLLLSQQLQNLAVHSTQYGQIIKNLLQICIS